MVASTRTCYFESENQIAEELRELNKSGNSISDEKINAIAKFLFEKRNEPFRNFFDNVFTAL